ncbi:MAG: hypothetical protein D6705_08275 [Deltaproteobacteria bacterium]|nr:MAG: hypothetical protein D6705_08275 [Deltaproteobacteria bacterium]
MSAAGRSPQLRARPEPVRRVRDWMLVLLVVIVVGACTHRKWRSVVPSDVVRAKEAEAYWTRRLQRRPEDVEARTERGLVRLVALGDTKGARADLARVPATADPMAAFARLLMADQRLEFEDVLDLADAVVPHARGRDLSDDWTWVAASIAAYAEEAADEVPDGRKRLRALMARLDLEDLPMVVRRPLLSAEGAWRRIEGGDVDAVYRRQGCVKEFAAGPLLGHHGALDLPDVGHEAWRGDGTRAPVVALSCAVRLWNGTLHPGVRVVATDLAVEHGPLRLEAAAEGAFRIYVDGHLVERTDVRDRYPAKWRTLAVEVPAGTHRVVAAVAVEDAAAWFVLRAHDGRGRPLVGRPSDPAVKAPEGPPPKVRRIVPPSRSFRGVSGPYRAEVHRALRLAHALAEGDSDAAERLATALRQRAPRFAEGRVLTARFEALDPSRAATISRSREERDLRAALEIDPELEAVRVRLLQYELERGNGDEVRAELRRLPEGALDSVPGLVFAARVHRTAGDEVSARKAMQRARKLHPRHCGLLELELEIARERSRVADEDRLIEAMAHCPNAAERRAKWAFDRGRLDLARRLWRRAVERVPDDETSLVRLAETERALGDADAARDVVAQLLRLRPYDGGTHVAWVDALASAGRTAEAREHLRRAIEEMPFSEALREAAARIGFEDELTADRGDGRAAYLAFLASADVPEGVSEVLVYDRTVSRVYADGTVRSLVHLVTYLATKDAIDRHGEVRIPEGAQAWTIRSLKPDGTMREPERVSGKESVSLRDLEIGDAVELEFVMTRGPRVLLPGYAPVAGFRFQGTEAPYVWSELTVISPEGLDLGVVARNGAPAPTVTRTGGLVRTTFLARNVPRLGIEPHMRDPRDEVPHVSIWHGDPLRWWNRALASQLDDVSRTNPELRRLARTLVRGASDDREKFDRLWKFVSMDIEKGDGFAFSPTVVLSMHRGQRIHLLRTMLREVGVHSEIWLARSRFLTDDTGVEAAFYDEYEHPVLMVFFDGLSDGLPVMADARGVAPGYLPPPLSGARAFRLHLDPQDGSAGFVRLPKVPPELADRRTYDVTVEVDGLGRGRIEGRIELTGVEAFGWRQALESLPPDRHAEVFETTELARLRIGATLIDVDFAHEDDVARPLVVTFSGRIDGWGVRQGRRRVLPTGVFPVNPARPYATLQERKTGLLVSSDADVRVRWTVRAKDGTFVEMPRDAKVSTAAGTYRRTVRRDETGREVRIEIRSRLRAGVYPPDRYGQVRTLAQQVAEADGAVLTLDRGATRKVARGDTP